jgi:hypothetical protein
MNNQKQFFNVSLACDLVGKSIDQVLEQCAAFDPQLFTEDMLQGTGGFFDDPILGKQRREWADAFGLPTGDEAFESIFSIFDARASFHCHFKLQDYEAFSYVGIHFINNTAVECIVSLGEPDNFERYRSELEVTKVFLVSLEELYLNGRIQEESEPGTRVYTWKKDNRTVVSFISYPPSGSPKDTSALLSVQIRDTQLHPQGAHFELLYNQAQKYIRDLVRALGDE